MDSTLSLQISDYMATMRPGSVLHEICERTLVELCRERPFDRVHDRELREVPGESKLRDFKNLRYYRPSVACVHKNTGQKFESMQEASRFFGLHKDTIKNDIRGGRFKHGVYII